jgi:orotidine-5'-phosphate decarboxylase
MGMRVFANPIAVAIDESDLGRARALALAVKDHVGCLKIGMEFYYRHGREGYEALARLGLPIFLDLKLHDIPMTVSRALKSLMSLEPSPKLINVHASGGHAMVEAAAAAVEGQSKLIAVTVLTSLSDEDLQEVGLGEGAERSLALASLAKNAGADGVVCSPLEVTRIKGRLGGDFLAIVPGVRPEGAAAEDQKRTATPQQALKNGADLLVIGRPITQAAEPGKAAQLIAEGLTGAD